MAKLSYAAIIERDQRTRALAELGLRLDLAELPRLMPRLVDLVDPAHLELLAESRSILGVDGYWLAESDDARRRLIKGAYELHRKKGTPYALKLFFRAAGFGEIKLHEGGSGKKRNGTVRYRDGFHLRGSSRRWAHYQIEFLTEPIRKNQTDTVARGIGSYAPARSILTGLKQKRGVLLHNGKALRNGQYFRGKVNIWQI